DGTLDWDVPAGTWQVFAFKEMPTGQKVVGGAGEGPQLVLDHMNKHAFDEYAERVGGTARQYAGQYFGNGLRPSSATVWRSKLTYSGTIIFSKSSDSVVDTI